ncbi:hypothetical protein [uncultured Ilyobacter sp.]|uniref:hypothetical protein n=1 Tax=uncultured Ilyobacter sp. TaxID=544433 RepID=UPI0029BFFB44|nr:hypothetical protein [uncultured Ilyobacter sp.]
MNKNKIKYLINSLKIGLLILNLTVLWIPFESYFQIIIYFGVNVLLMNLCSYLIDNYNQNLKNNKAYKYIPKNYISKKGTYLDVILLLFLPINLVIGSQRLSNSDYSKRYKKTHNKQYNSSSKLTPVDKIGSTLTYGNSKNLFLEKKGYEDDFIYKNNIKNTAVNKKMEKILNPTRINYTLNDWYEDALYIESKTINAIVDNKTYEIFVSEEDLPLSIFQVVDFDKNGMEDALIEVINGYGGNCCGNSYFFVSAFPDNRFSISKIFGLDWDRPEINFIDGKWVITVEESNGGFNNGLDFPREIEVILENGNYKIIKDTQKAYLKAITEMTSLEFDMQSIDDQIKILEYDLNNDGYKEKFKVKFWNKWGRILTTIIDGESGEIINNFSHTGIKRIGVLSSKTNGYNDIVLDQSMIIKWNGETYYLE